jgi:signal recognition particle receptor subunit beta
LNFKIPYLVAALNKQMSHELLCSMTIPCSWRVGLMKKLIEIILNDQVAKEENPNILEMIDLLSHSNEREFTAFLNEFEDIGKRLSLEKIDKTQELLEFICIEVDKSKKEGKLSKTNVIKSSTLLGFLFHFSV